MITKHHLAGRPGGADLCVRLREERLVGTIDLKSPRLAHGALGFVHGELVPDLDRVRRRAPGIAHPPPGDHFRQVGQRIGLRGRDPSVVSRATGAAELFALAPADEISAVVELNGQNHLQLVTQRRVDHLFEAGHRVVRTELCPRPVQPRRGIKARGTPLSRPCRGPDACEVRLPGHAQLARHAVLVDQVVRTAHPLKAALHACSKRRRGKRDQECEAQRHGTHP